MNQATVVRNKKLDIILWSLYATVTLLAIYVWGNQLRWDFSNLNAFTIFPVLGLTAFSLMWVHYVSGVIRDIWFPGASTKKSFTITSMAVLVLILFHPALLTIELYRHGSGLPPGSYKNYVAPGNTLYVTLGVIGLSGLLVFELKRFFGKKPWWKYLSVVGDVAILLIALHSLTLGQHLQSGWFRYVWYFYIITIIGCIGRIYYLKYLARHNSKQI